MSYKKRIFLPVFGVIVITLTLYYLFAPKETMKSTPYQDSYSIEDILVEEWKEYRSQSGSFVVTFPSLPQHASESVSLPNTNDIVTYEMFLSQSHFGTTFLINIIQYPDSFDTKNSTALLQGIVQEMVAGQTKRLTSQATGTFLTHPSIDFVISEPTSGELFSKAFLISKTVYILSVIDTNKERGEAAFKRFVSGFTPLEAQKSHQE